MFATHLIGCLLLCTALLLGPLVGALCATLGPPTIYAIRKRIAQSCENHLQRRQSATWSDTVAHVPVRARA